LIEGWATYCELNVYDSKYSKVLESMYKEFLNLSLSNKTINEKVNILYKNKINYGFSKKDTLNTILNFTQYPGFVESYYFGAFWIDMMVKDVYETPIEFLNGLKGRNIGDFIFCKQNVI